MITYYFLVVFNHLFSPSSHDGNLFCFHSGPSVSWLPPNCRRCSVRSSSVPFPPVLRARLQDSHFRMFPPEADLRGQASCWLPCSALPWCTWHFEPVLLVSLPCQEVGLKFSILLSLFPPLSASSHLAWSLWISAWARVLGPTHRGMEVPVAGKGHRILSSSPLYMTLGSAFFFFHKISPHT